MTTAYQIAMMVKLIWDGVITEQEATELLIALKHGNHDDINKLMEEHKDNKVTT